VRVFDLFNNVIGWAAPHRFDAGRNER